MDESDGTGMLNVTLDKSDWISACRKFQVEGTKSKGRDRKTWNECVKVDIKSLGLVKDDARN